MLHPLFIISSAIRLKTSKVNDGYRVCTEESVFVLVEYLCTEESVFVLVVTILGNLIEGLAIPTILLSGLAAVTVPVEAAK